MTLQKINAESPDILKVLISAHRQLAELKGVAKSIPNKDILLFMLTLRADLSNLATKEVANYSSGIQVGYDAVKSTGLLTLNTLLKSN